MKKIVILCAGVLIGVILTIVFSYEFRCWSASHEIRDVGPQFFCAELSRNRKYISQRIKKGMSKARVQKVIGFPHNSDNEKVWFWAVDYPSFIKDNFNKKLKRDADGVYILFNDKGEAMFSGFRDTETGGRPWVESAVYGNKSENAVYGNKSEDQIRTEDNQ